MTTRDPRPRHERPIDPRLYQIAFLGAFLAFVTAYREFTLSPQALGAAFAAALGVQLLAARALGLQESGVRSALISALSIGLLLRTGSPLVAALAGGLAIGSKFVLRIRGKHVFNPTNFGILATVWLTGEAWVSPSQWGQGTFLAFFIGALGLGVTRQARSLDVSLAFLAAHAALHFGRVLWLGQPLDVLAHRLSSGGLIVFTFFMISDPRTIPDRRSGRVLFAVLVALVAYALQFGAFVPSAPLWALLFVSPLGPVLDRIFRGTRFVWHPSSLATPRVAATPGARATARQR